MAEGGARAPLVPIRHHQSQPGIAVGSSPRSASAHTQPFVHNDLHLTGSVPPPPTPAPLLRVPPKARNLCLRKSQVDGYGFGFTLRHFILYPPDSVSEPFYSGRNAGFVNECMDTIFVKSVREGGAAHRSGLCPGDRLLAINRKPITGWPYSRVVQLIKDSPNELILQVVPKEADMLQTCFGEVAYNPETNQRPHRRNRERGTNTSEMPLGLGVGGVPPPQPHSYYPAAPTAYRPNNMNNFKLTNDYPCNDVQSRMLNNQGILSPRNNTSDHTNLLYTYGSEHFNTGATSRLNDAQPQIPVQRLNYSKRQNETIRVPIHYASPPSSPNYSSRDSASCYSGDTSSINSSQRNQIVPLKHPYTQISQMPQSRLPVQFTSRYDNDERRESNASLSSSVTESKDSLSSRESMSTLTGTDPDNYNNISNRMRKNFAQKEAFLMGPSQPTGWATGPSNIQQREFYGRPQRLHKPTWPPSADYSPSKNKENIHDENERMLASPTSFDKMNHIDVQNINMGDKIDVNKHNSSKLKSDISTYHSNLAKIQENKSVFNDSGGNTNGTTSPFNPTELIQDKRYPIPNELQIVSNRTKQFESVPSEDRTALYRSELARLSTKKPEPTVALRRKEFESRGGKRDARSLDAQLSIEGNDVIEGTLSGNIMTVTCSKHLTCPPPDDYEPESDKIHVRLRSNSTGSEGLPARRTHTPDGIHVKRRLALSKEEVEALIHSSEDNWSKNSCNGTNTPASTFNCDINDKQVPNGFNNIDSIFVNKNNNLISFTNMKSKSENDESKNHYNNTNKSEIQPNILSNESYKTYNSNVFNGDKRPERPTQLSLASGEKFLFPGGVSGMQVLGSSPTSPSSLPSQPQSPSGVSVDDVGVVRRQKNSSDLGAEEERAMRRVSYLKATWADQLNYDSDNEQQSLRSAHRRWRPPRFPDDIQPLRRLFEDLMTQTRDKKEREEYSHDIAGAQNEELEGGKIIIEGGVQIKMVLTNHKRASDRSWKHVHAVLQGPKLTLYRNHHQSPTVGGSNESLNLQFSMADLAGDYTKRKHVLRVTSAHGAEFLLQAGNAAEAASWLHALKSQTKSEQMPADSEIGGLSPPHSKKTFGTRNVSPTENTSTSLTASPKSKTWKGRVARQFKRIQPGGTGTSPMGHHGVNSPSSRPTGVMGIPLELCESLPELHFVPKIVGFFTRIVEERGLEVVGLYRIPGNKSSVTALMDSLEKSTNPDLQDTRWTDVNVVSSLLKTFFRRLPNPLLTEELYPKFIIADKLTDNPDRLQTIKRLIKSLPDHYYETLKFLMEHLKRVIAKDSKNKMDARNLAIVFGPTLVRSADDDMQTMVNDMASQCRIIESLLNHLDWYFDEDGRNSPIDLICEEELPSSTSNQALLLQNVKKIEGKLDGNTKTDIVSSIISAANRKIQRKPRKHHNVNLENFSPNHSKTLREGNDKLIVSNEPAADLFENERLATKTNEASNGLTDKLKWHNTEKKVAQSKDDSRKSPLLKIEAAGTGSAGVSNSNHSKTSNIAGKRPKTEDMTDGTTDMVSSLTQTFDQKLRSLHSVSPNKCTHVIDDASIPYVDEYHEENLDYGNPSLHRSMDFLNQPIDDTVKKCRNDKIKSELNSKKDDPPQISSIKCSYDIKISDKYKNNLIVSDKLFNAGKDSSVVYKNKSKSIEDDCDSEKDIDINSEQSSPNDIPDNNKNAEKFCFSEKSYHEDNKKDYGTSDAAIKSSLQEGFFKKSSFGSDKTDIVNTLIAKNNKLKRSESLNRETIKNNKLIISEDCNKSDSKDVTENNDKSSNSPKLRRSVSLNRSDMKVKRTDSLTKNEKTETNILRRRELNYGGLNRASAKLKRKNGMPERSIKRRHTVGGTKDFDKDEWVALSSSRTSSPDLPATITDVPVHHHVAPIPLESHV